MKTYLSFLVVLLCLSACDGLLPPTEHQSISKPANQITLQTLEGTPVTLSSITGKPLVLNVWSTWCTPCVKELPSLVALAKEKQKNLSVRLVSFDHTTETIHAFLKQHNIPPEIVLWDPNGKILRAAPLHTMHLPTTYLLDKSLVVKDVKLGEHDWNSPQMLEHIQKIVY